MKRLYFSFLILTLACLSGFSQTSVTFTVDLSNETVAAEGAFIAGGFNGWTDGVMTDNGDGTYSATFDLPAGDYEAKVALDSTWDVNYGVDGERDGPNYMFTMDADGSVTFTYNSDDNTLAIDTQ